MRARTRQRKPRTPLGLPSKPRMARDALRVGRPAFAGAASTPGLMPARTMTLGAAPQWSRRLCFPVFGSRGRIGFPRSLSPCLRRTLPSMGCLSSRGRAQSPLEVPPRILDVHLRGDKRGPLLRPQDTHCPWKKRSGGALHWRRRVKARPWTHLDSPRSLGNLQRKLWDDKLRPGHAGVGLHFIQ